jgi:hypothetical protein
MDQMIIASIICEVCPPSEVDMMISVLLNLFDNRASLIKLMTTMIDQEIERTGALPAEYSAECL